LSWKLYLENSELLYADNLVVIAETEDDLIKRHNEWKDKLENTGRRVNMNKINRPDLGGGREYQGARALGLPP